MKYKILVVDDEAATAKAVSFVLKAAGHTVETVLDGKPALELLTKSPDEFQVLITDHAMQMDGLELIKKLKHTLFKGRILVLSALLSTSLRKKYEAEGVTRFLYKPFEVVELRKAVLS